MVLEDVTEYHITADGTKETHLHQILLNGMHHVIVPHFTNDNDTRSIKIPHARYAGNNIAALVPGGKPE